MFLLPYLLTTLRGVVDKQKEERSGCEDVARLPVISWRKDQGALDLSHAFVLLSYCTEAKKMGTYLSVPAHPRL